MSRGVRRVEYLILKMESVRPFETSVNIYQSKRRNIPDDFNFQQRHCEKLKSPTGCFAGIN